MNMNQEKMGLFIAQLRKEKKLSQYALAELIPISRDAVSKWEQGRRCPEPECLLKLSEIFKVSVNELLYGERQTKSNSDDINKVSIKLYNESNKTKKVLKILIGIIVLLIFSFLVYYFVNTYNSLKAYHIYYDGDNIKISDGILVMTNEKVYFNLGGISSENNVRSVELLYKDKNDNFRLITKTDSNNIIFYDFKGYNDYINFENLNYIVKNLYLKIFFEENEETIELNYKKDFSNDYFIPKKDDGSISNDFNINRNLNLVERNIKEKFSCNENFCIRIYDNYELVYILNSRTLTITYEDKVSSEWIYNFANEQLIFQEYDNKVLITKYIYENDKGNCEIGKCKNSKSKINIFNDILKKFSEN